MKFLSQLPVIRAELEQGWTPRHVYYRHRTSLGMSYRQFIRYVARLPETGIVLAPPKPISTPESKPPASLEPASSKQEMRQFNYDPKSLDKDDLI